MFFVRAFLVWLAIMAVESLHGALRQIFLAPLIGDFPARRIVFFTGMGLIFLITCLFIRWIDAPSTKALLAAGLLWAAVTLTFEFAAGIFVLNYSTERLIEDYDPARGGLMGFGLLFMVFAPFLAARLRDAAGKRPAGDF